MRHVLVIDDDPEIPQIISEVFALELPSRVTSAGCGELGLKAAQAEPCDLIILDLTLPDIGGLDVCKKLRAQGVDTPIICLTSRADPIDKIVGLENGADDYITKPFHPRELVARIKAVLRRTDLATESPTSESAGRIAFGDLHLDLKTCKVTLSGAELDFTSTEFMLVALFAQNPGRVFNREQLLTLLGYQSDEYNNSITAHICRIRGKIEKDLDHPFYIRTVRGIGYRFTTREELAAVR